MTALPPQESHKAQADELAGRAAREARRYQQLIASTPRIRVMLGNVLVVGLLMLGGYWLLRRMGQEALFVPVWLLVLGVTWIEQLQLQAMHRRINALVELLDERGMLKR